MIRRLADLWDAAPFAFWLVLLASLYFVVMAVRLTVIDVRSHLLPNRIVFPSYGVAGILLLAAALLSGSRMDGALAGIPGLGVLAGAAALWVLYFLLRLVYPPGMGFGDVKLAGVLGLYLGYLGWGHVFAGTFLAFLLGGLWGLVIIVTRRGSLASAIPFGPFMLAGAAAAMVVLPA
ncbi:prepilin peptidase [Paenarthrobacter sp. NPDC089714]|uniref:prepilin peptidase n=1 Tax=unclassified Paenarthrobacter TaxID=2634190 RepID=UPI0038100206